MKRLCRSAVIFVLAALLVTLPILAESTEGKDIEGEYIYADDYIYIDEYTGVSVSVDYSEKIPENFSADVTEVNAESTVYDEISIAFGNEFKAYDITLYSNQEEFKPSSGISMNVIIPIPDELKGKSSYTVFYFNEGKNTFEKIESSYSDSDNNETVTFTMDHFSIYVLTPIEEPINTEGSVDYSTGDCKLHVAHSMIFTLLSTCMLICLIKRKWPV